MALTQRAGRSNAVQIGNGGHACVNAEGVRVLVIGLGPRPVPFLLHNQSWNAGRDPSDQQPVISAWIGHRRFLLRLKGGPQFRRQLAAYDLNAFAEELAIYQRGRGPLSVKMVAWLRRNRQIVAPNPRNSVLVVHTAADCLPVVGNSRDKLLWCYSGDYLRRWRAAYARQLQRWSEDAKYETRPTPPFEVCRIKAAQKFRARLASATH
jgi:hypothetical protein